MRIAILGFGLIGGSIARALRSRQWPAEPAAEDPTLVGWSPSAVGPQAALAEGIIDEAPDDLPAAVQGAEIVVLAAPPLACLTLLDQLAGALAEHLDPAATVTDVASTKRAIVERANDRGVRFVGGHPMGGRETHGYRAAEAGLLAGRPWIVCPGTRADIRDVERVETLAHSCGARPIRLDPAEHDAAVAAVSHLPLMLSVALAEAAMNLPAWPTASTLAAGGWRDMTRLGRGEPEMAAGIAMTNGPELIRAVNEVQVVLASWLAELEQGPDSMRLRSRFEAVRDRLGDT